MTDTTDNTPFYLNPSGVLSAGQSALHPEGGYVPPGTKDLPEKLEKEEAWAEGEQNRYRQQRESAYGRLHQVEAQRPAIPNQQQLGPPPDAKEYHKHSGAWLGAMAMIGALAAKSGRVSGTAALSAFSGAMKGWQEGNLQAYVEAGEKWKNENARTVENNRQVLEKYQMVLDNNRMNIDQQLAEIQRLAVENHDNMAYRLAREGHMTAIAQMQDKRFEYINGPKGIEATGAKLAATYDANITEAKQKALDLLPFEQGIRDRKMVDPTTGQPWTNEAYQRADMLLRKFTPPDVLGAGIKPGSDAALIAQENRERGGRGDQDMTAAETIEFLQRRHPPRSAPAISFQDWKREFRAAHGREPSSAEEMDFRATYEGTISAARVTAAAEPRALANSLTQLVKQKSAIESFERTAIANGEKLKELAGKVDVTGRPAIERWIRAGRQASGDPEVAAFNAQMQVYKSEVAKIITNPNLTGVLSDQSRREVDTFMSGGASARQINAVVDLLKQDFGRRMKSVDDEIGTVRGQLREQGGSVPPAATATSGVTQPGTRMHYDEQGNLVQ